MWVVTGIPGRVLFLWVQHLLPKRSLCPNNCLRKCLWWDQNVKMNAKRIMGKYMEVDEPDCQRTLRRRILFVIRIVRAVNIWNFHRSCCFHSSQETSLIIRSFTEIGFKANDWFEWTKEMLWNRSSKKNIHIYNNLLPNDYKGFVRNFPYCQYFLSASPVSWLNKGVPNHSWNRIEGAITQEARLSDISRRP